MPSIPAMASCRRVPAFAEAVADAGLVFVGPPAAAIRAMGSKAEAKSLMALAGVPVVPGYGGERQEPDFLKQKAYEIGYPVLIKAVAGGGGRGMRRVTRALDFDDALAATKREALAAFGDEQVLVERYIATPRHIEVQVFGDRARQSRAPLRARLLGAAAAPEGAGGGAGARVVGGDPRGPRRDCSEGGRGGRV